jgi:CheY-like chemotaxis protein
MTGLGRGAFVEVLLVDDNQLDLMLFSTAARKAHGNMRVHTTLSAQQAIEYLQGRGLYADRALNPMPDVMVLDLVMPEMDGVDLLSWRKRFPKFAEVPILILSGANNAKLTQEAMALGAKACLVKPASFAGWKDVLQVVWNTGLTHKSAHLSPPLSRDSTKGR